MNLLLERLRSLLASRTPRERWLLVLAGCVLGVVGVWAVGVLPLTSRLAPAAAESARLELELTRALRMAADVRALQGELSQVESRIEPGESTNLFSLLESLAQTAQVKDRLESIKPKQASGNERYPETRYEVSLNGATLEQAVRYLHAIESAPMPLIIRSIRLRARPDESGLLDVSFSVSSFTKA